jgi:hypothetical protein
LRQTLISLDQAGAFRLASGQKRLQGGVEADGLVDLSAGAGPVGASRINSSMSA